MSASSSLSGKGDTDEPKRRLDITGVLVVMLARAPSAVCETFEKRSFFVIPAKAGIQKILKELDSCFLRNDELPSFERNSKVSFAAADVRPSRSEGFAPSTENSAMGKIGGKKRQEGGSGAAVIGLILFLFDGHWRRPAPGWNFWIMEG
jgi:hypothetical protein